MEGNYTPLSAGKYVCYAVVYHPHDGSYDRIVKRRFSSCEKAWDYLCEMMKDKEYSDYELVNGKNLLDSCFVNDWGYSYEVEEELLDIEDSGSDVKNDYIIVVSSSESYYPILYSFCGTEAQAKAMVKALLLEDAKKNQGYLECSFEECFDDFFASLDYLDYHISYSCKLVSGLSEVDENALTAT